MLDEMLATLLPMLKNDLPIEQIMICRIDSSNSCVSIMAQGLADASGQMTGRADCSADQLLHLQARWDAGTPELFAGILPDPLHKLAENYAGHSSMLVPVGRPEGLRAFLMLIAGIRTPFHERHSSLAVLLREPFTVALENDRRLHELEALRELTDVRLWNGSTGASQAKPLSAPKQGCVLCLKGSAWSPRSMSPC
jgi:hypothetical protein